MTPGEAALIGFEEVRRLGNEEADRPAKEGTALHGYPTHQRAEANR